VPLRTTPPPAPPLAGSGREEHPRRQDTPPSPRPLSGEPP
jgi:hypothetical protein